MTNRRLSRFAFVLPTLLGGCAAPPSAAAPSPEVPKPPPAEHHRAAEAKAPVEAVTTTAATEPTPAAIVAGEPMGSPVTNAPITSSSVPNAGKVIAAMKPQFKDCYDKARGGGPHIEGMVTTILHVGKKGKVQSMSLVRRSQLPPPLVECINKALSTAAFEPTPEDEIVVVPVRFEVPRQ